MNKNIEKIAKEIDALIKRNNNSDTQLEKYTQLCNNVRELYDTFECLLSDAKDYSKEFKDSYPVSFIENEGYRKGLAMALRQFRNQIDLDNI